MKRIRIMGFSQILVSVAVGAMTLFSWTASGEEGMWTFDNPPLKALKEVYSFEPHSTWFDHVRLSSVRIGDGGSGSFISSQGLILTNHHVAVGQLQKISTPEKDLLKLGFWARTPAQEVPCPDLEVNVLQTMENVTDKVLTACAGAKTSKEGFDARKAAISEIEKKSTEATRLRSDVITLYTGGEYWLYTYKKFKDIRMVFAPEKQLAFYGGDSDNFTFPRYNLDMAVLRVYENGKPHTPEHFLKFQVAGPKENDLVIVTGHPGSTKRLFTMSQVEFHRDFSLPTQLKNMEMYLAAARGYAARGVEETRQAKTYIYALENRFKARNGELRCLKNPETIRIKTEDEKHFRELLAAKPDLQKSFGSAWDEIADALTILMPQYKKLTYRSMPGYSLPKLAMSLVQFIAEIKKPDGKRLEGFHDSQLDSLKFKLFSPAPIYPELEKALLTADLKHITEELGADDPFVKTALDGQAPETLANSLIAGTSLTSPDERKKLVDGGEEALKNSKDPLVMLAVKLDPLVREMITWEETNHQSIVKAAGEKIGKARFTLFGKGLSPDATFSLRMTYGSVKGYTDNGTRVPPFTTFYGMLDRSIGFGYAPPFDLPKSFTDARDHMNLATPFNFISTCDVVGGNSGSPVVNREGELVGLIFDGNIHSLGGSILYDINLNRSLAVDTAAIAEALKNQYHADTLLKEILP